MAPGAFKSLLLGTAGGVATRASLAAPCRAPAPFVARHEEGAPKEAPGVGHGGHAPAQGESTPRGARKSHVESDGAPLDPAARHLAQLAPPPFFGAAAEPFAGATTLEVHARASLEHLLPALVRRVAWAGDGRRGSMRMELGAGALAGATVVVHADGGRVRVEIDAPAGADKGEWQARIEGRLRKSGLDVEHVEVT